MKYILKNLFPVICFLSVVQASFAQGGKTKFGFSGGATASNFNFEEEVSNPEYTNDEKVGFNGGLKLDVQLGKSEVLKLTPELFINQNGAKDEYYTSFAMIVDSISQNRVALDYIGFYLPFKINIPSSKGGGLYFMAAGYADYTLKATVESDQDTEEKVEFKSEKDKVDYGYRLSLGLMFSDNVGLELGYNKGIKDIEFSTQVNNTSTKYLVNNKGFTISLVALF